MPGFERQQGQARNHLASRAESQRAVLRSARAEHPLLAQQQSLGNQVMQRILRSHVIQAKLTINEPGDAYEQEAERVAEQVMRMPDPDAATIGTPVSEQARAPRVQRMCSECEEELHREPAEEEEEGEVFEETPHIQRMCSGCEEELHRQPVEGEREGLRTKGFPDQAARLDPDVEANINALRGGGQPLPGSVRVFFEPRFGVDFSEVRVHNDALAWKTSQALNAEAFTLGRDIFFGSGRYEPVTSRGRELLAHELTHVVQQGTGPSRAQTVQRMVRTGYVSCWHPGQAEHGGLHHPRITGDDVVSAITAADARAIAVASNAETQISDLRTNRASAGYTPPTALRDAFLTAFGLDVTDPMSVSDRQLELIQRRYRRVREILEGGWIRYTCRGRECEAGDWAYSYAGEYRIYLCNRFYDDTVNEQGGTILHEAFHIYFPHIEDWEAPALANAHRYEQFARLLLGDIPATLESAATPGGAGAGHEAQAIVREGCAAPSEIPGLPEDTARLFGDVAELIIEEHYCLDTSCLPFVTDYFDDRVLGARPYIRFMQLHNALTKDQVEELKKLAEDEFKRPDVLAHVPGRMEFYEIKPNSRAGRAAGRRKLRWLGPFYKEWKLPYDFGNQYDPPRYILLSRGNLGPARLELYLRVQRIQDGLIVYDICARGHLSVFGAVLVAIIALVILALLAGKVKLPVPMPIPVLPPPTPVPIQPIVPPIPVPAEFGSSQMELV